MPRVIEISEAAHKLWKLMLEKGGSYNGPAMADLLGKTRLDTKIKQELVELGLIRSPKTNQFVPVPVESEVSFRIQASIKPTKKTAKPRATRETPSTQSTLTSQPREVTISTDITPTSNLEKRVIVLENNVKELSSMVNFLRDQWTKFLPSATNSSLSLVEIKNRLKETLMNLKPGWQPIDSIWVNLPSSLQKWETFQELVEELSDERLLSVNKGESQHQIMIRGESYGSIRRIS